MSEHDDLLESLLGLDDKKTSKRSDVERAPFPYLGSKYNLIPHLQRILPVRKKWVDHFCGSGIVTFNRKSSVLEVMNDRYGGIVAFYRCLQNKNKCEALIERCSFIIHSREEFQHCKDSWVAEEDDVERAAKWYTAVKLSVFGKGHAFARSTNAAWNVGISNSLELFAPIHQRLQKVQIENLDVFQCIKDFDSHDTVHYFDPPYINADQGAYENKWNRQKLERLLDCIEHAEGYCALSGYEDEQINSRPCWTAKHTFNVKVGAEMRCFTEENNKAGYENVIKHDRVEEVLWIKEC